MPTSAPSPSSRIHRRARSGSAALSALSLAVVIGAAGCAGNGVDANTHHRLHPSTHPKAGSVFVLLRHDGHWKDAAHSRRVGLVKFCAEPAPVLTEDRWVWGVPAGESTYVLYDAARRRTVRSTQYVKRLELSSDAVLAFATRAGGVEVVSRSGEVVVPHEAGYTQVYLAGLDRGRTVLELHGIDHVEQVPIEEVATPVPESATATSDAAPVVP